MPSTVEDTASCALCRRHLLVGEPARLYQDPQSHHSIIHTYVGQYDTTNSGWGAWTYKFQDQSNPLEGTSCDPTTRSAHASTASRIS